MQVGFQLCRENTQPSCRPEQSQQLFLVSTHAGDMNFCFFFDNCRIDKRVQHCKEWTNHVLCGSDCCERLEKVQVAVIGSWSEGFVA